MIRCAMILSHDRTPQEGQWMWAWLPLSLGLSAVPEGIAFNTAVSFVTNTNWQAYSGDTSPSGVDPQPAPRDKVALFNAALAEADSEPATSAISKSKKKAAATEADAEAAPAEAEEA